MDRVNFDKELGNIVRISKEFGASKVLLFGSAVEDIESAHDLDIAVSGIKPRDFFKYYGKVSMTINDEIDILDLEELRDHLFKKILSKGKVVYERKA